MNLNNHDRSLVVFLSFYLLSPANYSWSRSYLALLFFIHSYLTVILKRWYKHFLLKMALNICFKMILCVYMYVEQMKQDGLWVSNCSSEGHRNSLHYFIPVEVWHFPQKKKRKKAGSEKPATSSQNRKSDKIEAMILKTGSTNPESQRGHLVFS